MWRRYRCYNLGDYQMNIYIYLPEDYEIKDVRDMSSRDYPRVYIFGLDIFRKHLMPRN